MQSTDAADGTIVLSWTRDRKRWKGALREFPVSARARRYIIVGAVASVVLLLIAPADASSSSRLAALAPFLMTTGTAIWTRRAMLSTVKEGTTIWKLSDAALRVEADYVTELPWSEVVMWRRAAGHLIIELPHPVRRAPRQAIAAPLFAFDPESWQQTELLLRQRVGEEGQAASRADSR